MVNKFAGVCGCGAKVAAKKGTLGRRDDTWIVICSSCPSDGSGSQGTPKAKRAYKARSSWSRGPRKARRAGSSKRWSSKAKRTGARKRTTKAVWKEAPEINPALVFMPLVYTSSFNDASGHVVPCTPEYAGIHAAAAKAATRKGAADEMELLVTLRELEFLGHRANDDYRMAA
jgi:hypothetical protein